MKALIMTKEYPPDIYGGAGVHVDYLTRELARLMDVEVRCFGSQKEDRGRLKVRGHGLDERLFRRTNEKLKSPLEALSHCIGFNMEPIEADVVHCHTWYTHFGGVVAKLAYGLPLVITTHSLEPLRPWKREQLGRGYDLSTWIERAALGMCDAIVAVSRGMKEDILRLFDVDSERVKIIHNGIDTEEYHPVVTRDCFETYGIDPEIPYVLFVGRITRQKGIIHLVNAIPHLDSAIQVVLCAGAPDTEEIAREMEEGVRRVRNRRGRVVWIREMVHKKTIIELYSNASVFCCPSIYEPFGIINLEAMACGTPVVATAVGGIKEVVLDGETGLLVPVEEDREAGFEPKNSERFVTDLAEAVNRLMGNEDLRRRMGEAGRRRAIEVFSWKAVANKVAALYRSLLR